MAVLYADAHADTFYEAALKGLDPFDAPTLHVNLPRMRAVGQRLQVCSVFTPARYAGVEARDFALRIIDRLDASLRGHPESFAPVRTRAELRGLDRVGLIPWLEGAGPLMGDLSMVDAFFERGVRGVGLTHNHRNEVADGCGVGEPRRGLSDFGRALVPTLEARAIAIDCAHLPEPAFSQVMDLCTRPPCISHTGCRELVPITRNADDTMLRAIALRGGFAGIDFYPGHLLPNAFAKDARRATADDVAAHVIHAINVCGEDHVGFGSDFDGFEDTCEDLRHLGDLRNVESALRRRGLSERVIERVFGLNLLDYLQRVLPE